jgi:cation diffusion facilitator family transporter
MAGSAGEVIKSLVVNMVIASGKGVAAAITGSGAMLAETLHSFADCGNQVLLLVGIKKSQKPPDARHPLGYGRNMYFYSFIVALLLFTGGGMFSIYEGVHKMQHPEPVGDVTIGIIILLASLGLEGWATIGNIRSLNKRRGKVTFFKYLRESKDSDLIVVFGENSAAVLGLAFALAALFVAKETGDGRWDAAGSLAIGVVLIGVAVFLAVEIKALLVGEAADMEVIRAVSEIAASDPNVKKVLEVITIQQGPGEIMLMMKLHFQSGIESDKLVGVINSFEEKVRAKIPEAKWSFIEPDHVP